MLQEASRCIDANAVVHSLLDSQTRTLYIQGDRTTSCDYSHTTAQACKSCRAFCSRPNANCRDAADSQTTTLSYGKPTMTAEFAMASRVVG
jgi:hypothetical protein